MALESSQSVAPGAYVDELIVHSPSTELHYNSSDELIKIVKLTVKGARYEREIRDPDITDYTVDRIVTYSPWVKTRGR